MSPQERQQLKALFVATAAYFGQEIADAALALFVEDLADLPFADVAGAMREVRRDPKTTRCPLPSAIRARLTPESNPEGEAVMIVGRIIETIARIGPYDSDRAKAAIGPVGWRLVQLEGGWEHLCTIESDALPTLKAQWRGLAKVLIERGATSESAPLQITGSRNEGLSSFGEMLTQIATRPNEAQEAKK